MSGIEVGWPEQGPMYAGVDYGKRKLAIAIIDSSPRPKGFLYDLEWTKPTTKRAIALQGPELEGDHLLMHESTASDIFRSHRPSLVAIERPLTQGKVGSEAIMSLNQVSGMYALAARGAEAEVTYVMSSSWKKDVCGNGGFGKAEVAAWVAEEHPEWFAAATSQDCLDAFCLALAAKMEAEAALVGADSVL